MTKTKRKIVTNFLKRKLRKVSKEVFFTQILGILEYCKKCKPCKIKYKKVVNFDDKSFVTLASVCLLKESQFPTKDHLVLGVL